MASLRAPQKKEEQKSTVSLRAPVWQARGPHRTKRTKKIDRRRKKGVPLEPARRVCTINRGQKDERKRESAERWTARCGGTGSVAVEGCVPEIPDCIGFELDGNEL